MVIIFLNLKIINKSENSFCPHLRSLSSKVTCYALYMLIVIILNNLVNIKNEYIVLLFHYVSCRSTVIL